MKHIEGQLIIQLVAVLVFSLGIQSCTKQASVDQGDMYVIPIQSVFETERSMKLSELVDTIEYLELKTPEGLIISTIRGVKQVEDFLLIQARMVLYKFTLNGDYVCTVGGKGQGPGEYTGVYDFDVDYRSRRIVISDSGRTHYYDFDGNYLESEKSETISDFAVIDTLKWVCCPSPQIYPFRYVVLNANGDTLRTIANPNYGKPSKNEGGVYGYASTRQNRFYRHQGQLYTKGQLDEDTVYRVEGTHRVPHIAFEFRSLHLPDQYASWYDYEAFQKNAMNYWQVPAVFEDERYIYATVQRARWDDDGDDFRYVLYDKVTREGFVPKKHAQQKIKDDILGCIDFWPRFESEDYFYDKIEWYDLQNMLKEGHYTIKPELQKQFDTFDYGTNELIIRCKKKKM
ncbi:MAG: 6-bladed beta-propeller [Parabacteroides sp.]|nr:6-bladed beta-propeller [bacterium]MDY4103599.1 6-bladed beta-propeller [Parabacteroides sp.]